jgi:molecular chaperone DnaK
MVKDAEAHATDDQARRELIDARNQADTLVYSVERTLAENKAKLDAADISRVEAALSAAKDAVKSEELSKIRTATTELQHASHAIAEALYKAGQGQPQQPASSDVVDGEVVETV